MKKRLALPVSVLLLILALASFAGAQTTNVKPSDILANSSTVSIPNIPLVNGDYLWLHPGAVPTQNEPDGWLMPSEDTGMTCGVLTSVPFVDPNPNDANPVVYSKAYICPSGQTASSVLKGYYYRTCRGGKGGGCYTHLVITSGFVTLQ